MSFIVFSLICAAISGIGAALVISWLVKHPDPLTPSESTFTLENIVWVVLGCLCPIINVFVIIGCVVFFFMEVAPKVVLFKPHQ